MRGRSDPNRLIDRFNDYLGDSLRALRDLKAATTHRDLQGQLSIDAFFRAAVGFEAFQSDWLIAVVQRDPSGFLPPQWWTHVEQSVAPKLGEGEAGLGPALVGAYKRIAKRPRSEDVRAVIDPGDRNVTLKDVNDLRRRGVVELAAPYRARLETLLRDQRKLIDAVLAVRNCIAHRSPASVGRMNEKLRALPSDLRRGNRNVSYTSLGSYLGAKATRKTATRCEIFHQRLREAAETLRV